MVKAPCHRCPERYIGCHADCERYHRFLVLREEERELIQRNRRKDLDFMGFMADSAKRMHIDSVRKSLKKRRNDE